MHPFLHLHATYLAKCPVQSDLCRSYSAGIYLINKTGQKFKLHSPHSRTQKVQKILFA